MLRIYSDALEITRLAVALSRTISRQNPGLADQLSRAAISVPLNIAEATGVIGRNKRVRFGTALGSAREVRSCLEIAVVCGFAEPLDARSEDRLDKVIATLFKLAR